MNPAALQRRVRLLEDLYREIEATRMAGLGITNPRLAVVAVGFEAEAAGGASGVLVTPWFMNLVWLPDEVPSAAPGSSEPEPAAEAGPAPAPLAVGASRARTLGHEAIDFLGAFEPGIGAFETCSLFSPMFEFVDQAAALATAQAALQLRRQPPAAEDAPASGHAAAASGGAPGQPRAPLPGAASGEAAPSRRAFLTGRRAA